MSRFEALLACILSGQMIEAQIVEEMKNMAFLAYYKQRI